MFNTESCFKKCNLKTSPRHENIVYNASVFYDRSENLFCEKFWVGEMKR